MPLVYISLLEGKSPETIRAIADGIHNALVKAIGIPHDDRFQTVTEHKKHQFFVDRQYMGIERTDDALLIQIVLKAGRTPELKQALYLEIVANLLKCGIRKEDVMIVLTEGDAANWSFGNGIAQLIQ